MKKVWFIDESLDKMGGVERIISTLANELSQTNIIELISLHKTASSTHFEFPKNSNIQYVYNKSNLVSKKVVTIKPVYYGIRFFEEVKRKIEYKMKIPKYAKQIKKDDIVIFGRVSLALLFIPHIKNVKKIIVREAVHYYYNEKKYNMNKFEKIFSSKVDTFIVSSDECIKTYKEKMISDKINYKKLYNPLGIIPKNVYNEKNKSIISIGRYDTQKGYDHLIYAFKLVVQKYPDWTLRIVGDGYYKENLQKLIKTLELEKNVILIPSVKDVVKEFSKASIFVMASRFEGYANSLVEAMACGLPVITYDWLEGPRDIVEHDFNGIIVELVDRHKYFNTLDINEIDVKNMANEIIRLLENPKLRNKYSKNAVEIEKTRRKNKIISEWKKIIME